jgi:two-component system cell cycle sensor histidine kinase/response regulator CckA
LPMTSRPEGDSGGLTVDTICRIISERVSDLVLVADAQGKRLYMNSSYREIFKDPETLIGRDFLDTVHADDRQRARKNFEETVSTGAGEEIEYRIVLRDGSLRFLRTRSVAMCENTQAPLVVMVSRDLTGDKDSEKELRLLAQAVVCTKDAFCLTDLNNNFLFVNKAFCETYGYTEQDLIGANARCVLSPSVSESVREELRRGTFSGGWNGTLMNRRKDGTEFPVEIWTSTVNGDAGEVVATVSVARDITRREQAEAQLRETTERLRLTLDNLTIVAYELDSQGKFLLSRGKGLAKLGLQPDEIVGRSVFDVYRDNPVLLQSIGKALGGALQQTEVEEGGIIWSSVAVPLMDGEGRVERVFGTATDITDLKRAQEALRNETELWHALMDNIPDPLFCKDTRSRYTRINRAHAALLGVGDPADAIGETDADYLPFESALRTYSEEQAIIRTGEPVVGRIEGHAGPDGKKRWYSTTRVPFRDKQGAIVGIAGSSRDITTLKLAEELEAALYRIAGTNASAGDIQNLYASIHRIIGELMYAQNFFIALYDKEKDLLSFPYFVDVVDVPPEPGTAGRGLTAYVLRTGKSLLCDQALSDELERRGEASLVGIQSPIWLGVPLIADGKAIGAMVVQHYTDAHAYGEREQHILEFVSTQVAKAIEHKRAEEALMVSEEKYRTLFESSQDCIILSTPDGRLTDVNPAGVELFGYSSREEFLTVSHARNLYANPEDRESFKRNLEQMGAVKDLELAVKRRDGEIRWVLENSSALHDQAGHIIAYRSFLRDITERKRLEDQLRQAQKMEGIGTLAGGVAHDFNNLLGIILGSTTQLENNLAEPGRVLPNLENIRIAVQRGADLVRQLLTFAHKSDPSFTSVNVNDTVVELANMLRQTFPKTVAVATELAAELPSITADSSQLHQALLNLCVNSRDAILAHSSGGSGAGILTISTRPVQGDLVRGKFAAAQARQYVSVSVGDTGCGMAEATREHIFEPFYTTKGLGKGTGLGLSVVYGVLNTHRGFVEVKSQKNVGTTFTLYFPVPDVKVEPAPPAAHDQRPAAHGSETILLVEDEELLADVLRSMLEEKGYRVLMAMDGQEGLEIFRDRISEIRLVLSDMGLPRLGGYEMFLKMMEEQPGVKVILASGYFDPNLKIDLINAGAKDFIQKPYVTEDVLKRIREVIDA